MSAVEKKILPVEDVETTSDEATVTPTWFSQTYPETNPEDMAERYVSAKAGGEQKAMPDVASDQGYEAYRRRLEDRFQVAKEQAGRPVAASVATSDQPSQRRARPTQAVISGGAEDFRTWQEAVKARQANQQKAMPRRPSPLRIAGLFVMACTIGGAAGYGTSKISNLPNFVSDVGLALASYLPQADAKVDQPSAAPKPITVISKKQIKMARVDVQDAKGALNGPIALNIATFPADDATPLALRITGIPEDAYLTRGVEISSGEWLLKATETDNLKLVVPHAATPQLDLAVAAVEERTGLAAAPPREMTVDLDLSTAQILPANAGPEIQSAAVPPPLETADGETRVFISKGETLMGSGDVIAARQFFQKAFELGDTSAAYHIGQTYDPKLYQQMNVRGLQPDATQAQVWYEKAKSAGDVKARDALQNLLSTLQP